jgi:hypothetical protein
MSLVMRKGDAAPAQVNPPPVASAPAPTPSPVPATAPAAVGTAATTQAPPSALLMPLSFKVPPEFDQAFRDAAHGKRMKLNELLFAAFEAWQMVEKRNS